MSLVNAFHVYSSGDLSRKRKKDSLLSEDPNLTRIVSIRTNTPEEDTRLFYQPFVFLIVPNVISNIPPPQKKLLVKVFYTCSSTRVRIHFLTWRGSGYRDVITHGYVQDELLLDFLLGL